MTQADFECPLGGLDAMITEMLTAPAIVRPSKFWEAWNAEHTRLLAGGGFSSFKRTINRSYFNWVPRTPLDAQLSVVLVDALRRRQGSAALRCELDTLDGPDLQSRAWQRRTYAIFVGLLWDYVRARDTRRLLDQLDEPLLGCPVTTHHRGRRISQDLCNSVHEVNSMLEGRASDWRPRRVIELGGGYGRVAWVMLNAFPQAQYVLVDIPPALAIAQRYLTELFPGVPTFQFRPFTDGNAVQGDLRAARLVFLTPNQLDIIEPLDADLFVNISSLHEMRPEQIAHFLRAVSVHCRGDFYMKQWKRSINRMDGLVVGRHDYPIPASWQAVYSRSHPIQKKFFESLHRVGP